MDRKDCLIKIVSKYDLLVDMLDFYNKLGLRDLTEGEIERYIELKKLK